MAKRGFFAELEYQSQLAARRRMQAERAAARANLAAKRTRSRPGSRPSELVPNWPVLLPPNRRQPSGKPSGCMRKRGWPRWAR